jgi:hypothetical protein
LFTGSRIGSKNLNLNKGNKLFVLEYESFLLLIQTSQDNAEIVVNFDLAGALPGSFSSPIFQKTNGSQ